MKRQIISKAIVLSIIFTTAWVTVSLTQDQLSICTGLGQTVLLSSVADVRKAYHKFAVNCHPDKFKNPDEKKEAHELFYKIGNFYEKAIGKTPITTEYTPPPGYGSTPPSSSYWGYRDEAAYKTYLVNKALYTAATNGDTKAAEEAITQGANVNYAGDDNSTPLIQAAWSGHPDMVKLLIKYDADVNLANDKGSTALTLAAMLGRTNIVEQLLNADADINHAGYFGRTALIWAAKEGSTDTVKLLIQSKANLNQTDNNGKTALMFAARLKNLDIAGLLTEAGANVNHADDDDGITALLEAVAQGNINMVRLLIEHGADVNHAYSGGTALTLAQQRNYSDIAKLLQQHNARS